MELVVAALVRPHRFHPIGVEGPRMIQIPRKWRQRREHLNNNVEAGHSGAIAQLLQFAQDIDTARAVGDLSDDHWADLQFSASSMLNNIGQTRGRLDAIEQGIQRARDILDARPETDWAAQVRYNIANGLASQLEIESKQWRASNPGVPWSLFTQEQRESARQSRVAFAAAGYSDAPADVRGRALCNLGNALDHSGRWLEAYQAYVDAIAADPTNGNASGNAAELLRRRAAQGRGLPGHYAAVYEMYRVHAVAHRARTLEVAGERAAQLWDALPHAGVQGHVSHDGDDLQPYQQWVRTNRLALTVAVEGLGTDDPRWDSAMVEGVAVAPGEPDPPTLFTSMNVLKAEYLVARRLAFEGERALGASPYSQSADDPGTYANTLDMSLYGEPPAQLILAQRATLDLLDKIAVAANDHFGTGMNPKKVEFATFWTAGPLFHPRSGLPVPLDVPSAAAALAELAFDLSPGGLYPDAKTLRNAGTHRLVHLTHGNPTGVTEQTHSSIDAAELSRATLESLRVARAAYIYLIDLVHDQQDQTRGADLLIPLLLPAQN